MSQALCEFFGCLRLPFDKSLPVKDLYPSTAHQELQARLAFALQHRFPTLVTGDVGTGNPLPSGPSSLPWTRPST